MPHEKASQNLLTKKENVRKITSLLVLNLVMTLALMCFVMWNTLSSQKENKLQKSLLFIAHPSHNQLAASSTYELFRSADLMNRWNSSDCDQNIFINRSDQSIQRIGTRDIWYSSCRTENMAPASQHFGIFYFEMEIIKLETTNDAKDGHCVGLGIGLSPKKMPMNEIMESLGPFNGTYAYDCTGKFWGHSISGSRRLETGGRVSKQKPLFQAGGPWVEGMPLLRAGDVVGCGVKMATRQIIYTLNGQRLDTTDMFVDKSTDLYPTVTLHWLMDKVNANFGPKFKFDLLKE
ncbi:hypothetical protein niasHS_005577 [Heterodera schachtii]|uniref:B30.2/SPRY domain-containing protein n=1 Tax=Heterodera schachtii TaxID=97005 RepID=A0ABD2JZ10_HETSC